MEINSIIIDDEPLARKGLQEYIQDTAFLRLIGEFEHPLKAMELLKIEKIQLVFLDIQMPKITGIDFIRSLQNPPQVIFTTAYPQYAIDAFDINAVDYLLKPFSFDRFLKAVLKAQSLLENKRVETPAPTESEYVFIKADNKILKIRFVDILFVEALQNYVAIHTNEKKHIAYLTMKHMEEELPGHLFVKIHKSYIVSVAHVESIEGSEIKIGRHLLPVSRATREAVIDRILQNKLLKRPG